MTEDVIRPAAAVACGWCVCGLHPHLGDGGHHLQAAELDGRRKWLSARDGVARPQAGHVGTAHDQVADRQEHDGPLRVAKTRRVNQEREHLQEGEWVLKINFDLIRFALINPQCFDVPLKMH